VLLPFSAETSPAVAATTMAKATTAGAANLNLLNMFMRRCTSATVVLVDWFLWDSNVQILLYIYLFIATEQEQTREVQLLLVLVLECTRLIVPVHISSAKYSYRFFCFLELIRILVPEKLESNINPLTLNLA
jgi:hypothetical protein